MPINGTNVLHIIEARDEQEDESQYSNEEEGNDSDDDGSGANLVPCFGGDHISTVRALEVRYRLLSEGGCYNSSSLGDSTDLQTYTQCHRQTDTYTHTHTHTHARTHTKKGKEAQTLLTHSLLSDSPQTIGRRFQSVRSVLLWHARHN